MAEARQILSLAQIRHVDAYTREVVGVPLAALMENAGRAVAEEAEQMLEESGRKGAVVVFCGGGHNGGDGLVAARHLHLAGREVIAVQIGTPGEETRRQIEIVRRLGLPLRTWSEYEKRPAQRSALLIDALLGTGLERQVSGDTALAISAMRRSRTPILAVDIPSGIHGDSGAVMGAAVSATRTATFGYFKRGFFQGAAADYTGEIVLLNISLAAPPELQNDRTYFSEAETLRGFLPPRRRLSHKGTYGAAYLLCGSPPYSGAAVLCAQAALRGGAGRVAVGLDRVTHPLVKKRLLEAVSDLLPEVEAVDPRLLAERILRGAEKATVLAAGCGLGRPAAWRPVLEQLLPRLEIPFVLDADALNALGRDAVPLLQTCKAPAILTPHPGECSRLTGLEVGEITARRLQVAADLATASGAIVALKGAYTVIAAPDGEVWVNASGNPGLAKGGSGDVLCGLIAAYLAQGVKPLTAARAAVFVHGAAADLGAEQVGEAALVAGDLFAPIVAVQRSLCS